MTPLDVYYCGGSQVTGMGLPVTQALPVQVTRALRERWGRKLGHAYMLEYSGDPRDLERTLRARGLPRPFVLVLVPRNVYVWGVPQLGDLRRYLGGVVAFDEAVMDEAAGSGRANVTPVAAATRRKQRARRAWHAARSAMKASWYLLWLPTLPWWALRYHLALRSLRRYARQRGCRLFVLATPVPLRDGNSRAPGLHWYIDLLARYLRGQEGGDVVAADLYRRLQAPSAEPLHFYHDRMVHLTRAGTQRAAAVVLDAIAAGAARCGLPGDAAS
ncbi:MAG TPA: hypothetical protein VK066_18575 [Chloroflexota bacterium]|nr:hypothetical protein [Chloroflexota bacterium]